MNIDLSLLNNCDELEASLLRSILLFETKQKDEDYDQTICMRCILSIIVEGVGKYTLSDIKDILDDRFSRSWSDEFQKAYDKLFSEQLIHKQDDDTLVAETQDDGFFTELNKQTNELIDDIYAKYIHNVPIQRDPQVIKAKITEALSIYYKTYGYSLFDIQQKENAYPPVMSALGGLDEKSQKCLAAAIGDTISQATPQQFRTLNIWAKAFVITQMTKLDPLLTNFRQQQLQKKIFVLDTDFVIRSLAKAVKNSKEYHEILEYLRKIGCTIIIPKEIRAEALGCIREAQSIVKDYGEQNIINGGEKYLGGSKTNVFVEDFIALRKSDSNDFRSFEAYIGNYYDPNVSSIYKGKLRQLIGKENIDVEFKLVNPEVESYAELKGRINQRTNNSPQGIERAEYVNEEIADKDTLMFLTLLQLNKEQAEEELFPYKYYLLTRSNRTKYSAQELGLYKDFICNPQSLLVVLHEIGEIKENVQIINLFDNPFLVYLADSLWDKTAPLLKVGVRLQYADIERMRLDVENNFHDVITCKSPEEIKSVVNKYHKQGYKFSEELARVYKKNEEQEKEIEQLKKENSSLRKKVGKENYKDRILSIKTLRRLFSKKKK